MASSDIASQKVVAVWETAITFNEAIEVPGQATGNSYLFKVRRIHQRTDFSYATPKYFCQNKNLLFIVNGKIDFFEIHFHREKNSEKFYQLKLVDLAAICPRQNLKPRGCYEKLVGFIACAFDFCFVCRRQYFYQRSA